MSDTTPDYGAVVEAAATVLQTEADTSPFGFTVGRTPPPGDVLPIGWVSRAGTFNEGVVGDRTTDTHVTVQISCAGLTETQAEQLATLARNHIINLPYRTPQPITGRTIYQVDQVGGTILDSIAPLPGRHTAIDLYQIYTTPQ